VVQGAQHASPSSTEHLTTTLPTWSGRRRGSVDGRGPADLRCLALEIGRRATGRPDKSCLNRARLPSPSIVSPGALEHKIGPRVGRTAPSAGSSTRPTRARGLYGSGPRACRSHYSSRCSLIAIAAHPSRIFGQMASGPRGEHSGRTRPAHRAAGIVCIGTRCDQREPLRKRDSRASADDGFRLDPAPRHGEIGEKVGPVAIDARTPSAGLAARRARVLARCRRHSRAAALMISARGGGAQVRCRRIRARIRCIARSAIA